MGQGRHICGCDRRITHANAYSDSDSYRHSDGNGDGHSDSYANGYGDSHSHSQCDTDSYRYSHATTNAYAEACAIPQASPHAGTETIGMSRERNFRDRRQLTSDRF
jgi:hypothetical protein